jgi:hypothetical protein
MRSLAPNVGRQFLMRRSEALYKAPSALINDRATLRDGGKLTALAGLQKSFDRRQSR